MEGRNKMHVVKIKVSGSELDALEDCIVAWNLCNKHKKLVWTPEHGDKSEQEIFKMQDECAACKRYNGKMHKMAWRVSSRLFNARYKAH